MHLIVTSFTINILDGELDPVTIWLVNAQVLKNNSFSRLYLFRMRVRCTYNSILFISSISCLASKLWDGECGSDENELLSRSGYNLLGCKNLCDVNVNCGYFEYCHSGNCKTNCTLFSETSSLSKNENDGVSCFKGYRPCQGILWI